MISQAFSWWTNGLAAAVLSIERRFRPPRRFQLRACDRPFVLRSVNDGKGPLTASIDMLDGTPEPLSPALLERTRGSELEVVVPDSAVLEKQLGPLPGESRQYVDNVVRHRIETLFPWRSTETLFAAEVTDCPDGQIIVNVRATPRRAIALALDLAIACGASQVKIVKESGSEADKAIPLYTGENNERGLKRAKSIARYGVIGLILLLIAVIGESSLTQSALKADIANLDHAISDRQAILQLGSDRRTSLSFLESKKKISTIAVFVLEELSKILPGDTYLTDLTIDGGQLRMGGVSTHAVDLIPLLERTGRFKNAAFYAPTTRQANGMDHFRLETAIVPANANE
jgi:general secretion pathway protein L